MAGHYDKFTVTAIHSNVAIPGLRSDAQFDQDIGHFRAFGRGLNGGSKVLGIEAICLRRRVR